MRVEKGEAAVTAAHLEHPLARQVDELANRGELERIDSHLSDTTKSRNMRERFPILESLTYLNSCSQGTLSIDVREAYDRLTRRLIVGVRELGGSVVTPDERGALFCVASTDAERLVRALAEAGVVTSSRGGNVRLSMHFYNDEAEIDAALELMASRRDLLQMSR